MTAPKRNRFTYDEARAFVIRGTACELPKHETLVDTIAKRMVQTGEGVWHATAQVTGKPCWCRDCRPDVRRFA